MIDSTLTSAVGEQEKWILAPSEARFWLRKDFWYAEGSALLVRILFLTATAGMTRSIDLYSWQKVANLLLAGANPYASSALLNWPPLWMQFIYLFEKVGTLTGIPFILCVQMFLILVDLALIAGLYTLIQNVTPGKDAGRLVFWAISLNPVCILLTCQHGNFDGLVALVVILFLIAETGYTISGDPADWLAACVTLGVAILLKTTPLVLVPLLFIEARRLRRSTKFLGAILAFGPVALGMSIIYVLAPKGVSEHVLAYRSISGFFGITGLLGLLDLSLLSMFYTWAFPILLLISLAWITVAAAKLRPRSPQFIVAFAGGAMLAIPLFGPGYGPQYLLWSIPLVAALYHLSDAARTKRVILAAYIIAAFTYLAEYSLFRSHGALALQLWPQAAALRSISAHLSTSGGQTLVRLPLFVSLLAVFSTVVAETKRFVAIHL
jgi:hypothetical protein